MAKNDIHPKYYPEAKVTCACGNTFTVGATFPEISVDICSKCHPFYTGEQKLIDTAGRVEKFKTRRAKATTVKPKKPRAKKSKE
jgi:large subunit ribosomal protein L31